MQLADVKLDQPRTVTAAGPAAPVQVIAVTGSRAGSGKTTVSVNLAHALALSGQRCMLLDADPGSYGVNALLGLSPRWTLYDVANGDSVLDDSIMTGVDGLLVIPAASGEQQLASMGCGGCAGLVRAFDDFARPLDTLVVDASTGTAGCVTSFCRAANEIIVVVCDETASINDSIAQIELLSTQAGISRFRILASMVRGPREGNALFSKILARLGDDHAQVLSYAGYIPRDDVLRQATEQHVPVTSLYPRSISSLAIRNLARQVISWPRPVQAGGHVEFFVERLIQNDNSGMEGMS